MGRFKNKDVHLRRAHMMHTDKTGWGVDKQKVSLSRVNILDGNLVKSVNYSSKANLPITNVLFTAVVINYIQTNIKQLNVA